MGWEKVRAGTGIVELFAAGTKGWARTLERAGTVDLGEAG